MSESEYELLRRARGLQLLVLRASCRMSGADFRVHGERMEMLAQWCLHDLEDALAGPAERRPDAVEEGSFRALELKVTARVASQMGSCRADEALAIGASAEEVREQAVRVADALRRGRQPAAG